jgi:hypothetical protein
MRLVPRVVVTLSALSAALLGLLLPASPASAQTVQVHAFATTSHPYSDPVWFPLATPQKQGCMWNNRGCPSQQIQKFWAWDIMAQREPAGQYHQKVYAMGAGIVHIGATGQGCGDSHESRGNWVWINHGGGVISAYQHLSGPLLVHDGDYVSARTPIAYVGNSGYHLCKEKPYERFLAVVVRHDARVAHGGGLVGTNVQITKTYACKHGHKVLWPQHMPGHHGHGWNRWFDVPVATPIPKTSGSRSCIPAPATAAMPHPTLKRGSHTGLAATWAHPAGRFQVSKVRAMLQEYHPSISRWLTTQTHNPSGGVTRTYFAKLNPLHKYRLKVSFENRVGWSKGSPWVEKGFHS